MSNTQSPSETSRYSSNIQRTHSSISSRLKTPFSYLRSHAPHNESPDNTRDAGSQDLETGLGEDLLPRVNAPKTVEFIDETHDTSTPEDSSSQAGQDETHETEKAEQPSDQDNDHQQAKPPEYTSEAEHLVKQFTYYDTTHSDDIKLVSPTCFTSTS